MAGKTKGVKVSAFVGRRDKAIIVIVAKLRGITESQLIQEWIADDLKYVISTNLIEKMEKIEVQEGIGDEEEEE